LQLSEERRKTMGYNPATEKRAWERKKKEKELEQKG